MLILLAFVACTPNSIGEEESSSDVTESTTGSIKEEETQAPRFDYFEADMSEYVNIDPSVYEDIQITLAADLQISQEELERYIMVLRYQERGEAESETMVDEPLEWGDDAYIYYKGYIDGEAFDNGSNMKDEKPTALGLGSSDFIPGFEAGLVGVIPSETSKDNPVRITCRFPSWYSSARLAGKEAVFEVYVVYAVEHTIPDYDIDFIENDLKYEFKKDFYASDTAKKVEFEAYIRDYMETSMKDTIEEATYEKLWEYLLANAEFIQLPQMELDYYRSTYLSEFEYYYDYYKTYGYDVGTFDEFVCQSMGLPEGGDWNAEMLRVATQNVQYDILRFAVAQLEGMKTVSDKELDDEVNYWIDYYYDNYMTAVTKEEVLENLGEGNLRRSALTSKMHEFLLSRVTTSYESADTPEVDEGAEEVEGEYESAEAEDTSAVV